MPDYVRPFHLAALLAALVPCISRATNWSVAPVDPTFNAGWYTSVRIAPSGQPSACSWTPGVGIRYATYDGVSWTRETVPVSAPEASASRAQPAVDGAVVVLAPRPDGVMLTLTTETQLALAADGSPHIAHAAIDQNHGGQGLLIVSRRGAAGWSASSVEQVNDIGGIEVDAGGAEHLVYAAASGGLVYVRRDTDGTWTREVLDPMSCPSAMRLDTTGRPHVAYVKGNPSVLVHAVRDAGAWSADTMSLGWLAGSPALAVDPAGGAHVALKRYGATLDVYDIASLEPAGHRWTVEMPDPLGLTGVTPSIALDPQGDPVIAYNGQSGLDLRIANRKAGVWSVSAVDVYGNGGYYTSTAVNAQGRAFVTYAADISEGMRMAVADLLPGLDAPAGVPRFAFSGAVPDPVRAAPRFAFELPVGGRVRLVLFDAAGRRVRTLLDGERPAGRGTVAWDRTSDRGSRVPPGVYLARIEAAGRVTARRFVVLD